jgi:hypothetical protein
VFGHFISQHNHQVGCQTDAASSGVGNELHETSCHHVLEGKLMGFFLNNTQSHVNLKLKGELSGVNFLVGDQFTKT